MAHTEFYAGVLTPGFVNAHCHLELSYLKGAIPERCGFAEFTNIISQRRGATTIEDRVRAAEVQDQVMWREGVSAVADISNDDFTLNLKSKSAIEYHTFIEFYGLKRHDISPLKQMLRHPRTSLTPHSLYSVQEAPLKEILSMKKNRLSIHFLESHSEKELYSRRGELWDRFQRNGFECDFLDYTSPVERLINCAPKESSPILVHNCTLTDEDLEQLLKHFTSPIYWCICPRSNSFISGLKPPIKTLRQRAQKICIGTDSLSSNHSLSILEELKQIEGIELAERLNWATINGAEALGLEDMLGSVEVGKRPGLVLLEGIDMTRMELTAESTSRRIL